MIALVAFGRLAKFIEADGNTKNQKQKGSPAIPKMKSNF
jgi:hypothetical protein